MIKRLRLKNFAMVREAELFFENGFCAITGETGAGKSVTAEALEFLLGEKPYPQLIKEGESSCEVEGEFEISSDKFSSSFDFITGKTFTLKRIFDRNLKSRAFCCEKPVSVSSLKELGAKLADFYGQDQGRFLLEPARQLEILDAYGGLGKERRAYNEIYTEMNAVSEKLKAVSLSMQEKERLIDMYSFQLEEIEKLAIDPVRDSSLGERLARIKEKDKIVRNVSQALQLLKDGEGSVISRLSAAASLLRLLEGREPAAVFAAENISKNAIELEEVCANLSSLLKEEDISEAEIDSLIERDEKIKRLKKKYGENLEDILAKAAEFREKLAALEDSGITESELQKKLSDLSAKAQSAAKKLSLKRQKCAEKMSAAALKELKELGFEKASFRAEVFFSQEDLGPTGGDSAEYLFSANPDARPQPLRNCASGGELSRVALALKTVFAGAYEYDFSVFDEIDAGIGGNTSFLIGEKLRKISSRNQVLCITHAAQVAAFAGCHIKVEKKVRNGRTEISAVSLKGEDRQKEIARMLGSKVSPETALRHAGEILRSASAH